jgi:3-dehydroquinate synthetase
VKVRLVEQDRLEQGPRAFLNLGHTFGHALEQASGYAWRHGEAVALGMVAAAQLAARLGRCSPDLVARLEVLLRRLGLPVRYARFAPDDLWRAMRHDKKWRDGSATFVVLEGIGRPTLARDVPRDDVIAVLEDLREGA